MALLSAPRSSKSCNSGTVDNPYSLYYGAVQTMPFARPHMRDLLGALDFVIAKDYPARGEA